MQKPLFASLNTLVAVGLLLAACSSPTGSTSTPSASPEPSASPSLVVSSAQPSAQPSPPLGAAQGNQISNPGAEIAENPAKPEEWASDNWGSNHANLTWESGKAFSGEHFLSAVMADYQDGDAKWIFTPQQLKTHQWYEYSDYYRSDGRNRMIMSCQVNNQRYFYTVWQTHHSNDWHLNRFRFYNSPFRECNLTMMHVLDRNGYLHTDHHQLLPVAAQPLKRPLISITFDDIWAGAMNPGATELEKRGWKGSFYVTGKYARLAADPAYAHVDDIKSLIQRGHEIGSHSNTHPLMTSINNNDLAEEVKNNHDYLKFLGQAPEGFAYPFGDFTEEVETEVKRYHGYARTSLVGLNDKTLDRFRLRIMPVTTSTTTSELFAWIEDAERTSTWLILLFHDLKPGEGDATYTTSSTQYLQIMDYLERKKLTVLPVNAALKEVEEQR